VVELSGFVPDVRMGYRGLLARVRSGVDIAWFTGRAVRTVVAFEPLLESPPPVRTMI
jgi:hypothetical protein